MLDPDEHQLWGRGRSVRWGRNRVRDRSAPTVPNLDGSGAVDFPDLIQLLSAFGPCDGCAEDLDASGGVAFDDLIALLSGWGDC